MLKVFLIDVSGGISHPGDRLAQELFRELRPGDEFEVIYFDHWYYCAFSELRQFSNEHVHAAVAAFENIGGGGTTLGPPLEKARMLIQGNEVAKVIILSDGYWTI